MVLLLHSSVLRCLPLFLKGGIEKALLLKLKAFNRPFLNPG